MVGHVWNVFFFRLAISEVLIFEKHLSRPSPSYFDWFGALVILLQTGTGTSESSSDHRVKMCVFFLDNLLQMDQLSSMWYSGLWFN